MTGYGKFFDLSTPYMRNIEQPAKSDPVISLPLKQADVPSTLLITKKLAGKTCPREDDEDNL